LCTQTTTIAHKKEGKMASATTAEKIEMDSPGIILMPPLVFFTCLAAGGLLEFFFPQPFPVLPKTLRFFLGLGIGGVGFAFMIIAHEKFKRNGTNVPTNLPATTFVVQGAYRFSRNPMYVGGSVFFLGMGLMVGSPWMVAAYLPLGLYLACYVVPREEAYMERAFGADYRSYCRQVRRWI
jgi:protein-S-isoprenylcysteine O-methyltransferase Ste14